MVKLVPGYHFCFSKDIRREDTFFFFKKPRVSVCCLNIPDLIRRKIRLPFLYAHFY